MSFLDRLYEANTADLRKYTPLFIANQWVGLIWENNIPILSEYCPVLQRQKTHFILPKNHQGGLSQYLAAVNQNLFAEGHISGWRNEPYPLIQNYHDPVHAVVERAAMPIFGGCGYGVHLNGLTKRKNQTYLWIAKRASNKATDPNKLDQIAAGGIPYGIDVFSNLQKECMEEANISYALSQSAYPVSNSSYLYQVENGIRADVMFNYDLWLPQEFSPNNNDLEVSDFYCLPIEEVMELVEQTDQFKFNSAIVLIDLFIRHGYISPRHRDYQTLCSLLNPRDITLRTFFHHDKQ